MGVCGSALTVEDKRALDMSRKIDAVQAQARNEEEQKIKLLLLGAGESGKSTIFKQMRLLYGDGFSEDERLAFKGYIWANIIEGIKAICEASQTFGYASDVVPKPEFQMVMEAQMSHDLTPELGRAIAILWEDHSIQSAWARRSEYQVVDTLPGYFSRVVDMAEPSYIPTVEDLLLSRIRTTGIVEERFLIDGTVFVSVDVGGQRNERKKWIHCFDAVDAVIFVAALSNYDQRLFEDETVNRMIEAINLFDEICNSRWFTDTDMILFLNKRDLFEEKIRRVDIATIDSFRDYHGTPFNYDEGVEYFLNRFLSLNKKKQKEIYYHVTCATDTSNIKFTLDACTEIILKSVLKDNNFL